MTEFAAFVSFATIQAKVEELARKSLVHVQTFVPFNTSIVNVELAQLPHLLQLYVMRK